MMGIDEIVLQPRIPVIMTTLDIQQAKYSNDTSRGGYVDMF